MKPEMASYVVDIRYGSDNKQYLDEARNGFIYDWSRDCSNKQCLDEARDGFTYGWSQIWLQQQMTSG